jgi:predicted O-methyltransferase YrrM
VQCEGIEVLVHHVATHEAMQREPSVNPAVTDAQVGSIPGWFMPIDIALFRFFLGEQVENGRRGDLAELGVYLGSSAILIGAYQQPGETFTVVDLFGGGADGENGAEARRLYRGLTQVAFEANYRGVHGGLPVVIKGPSTEIGARAARGRHRFVHIDASHEHSNVVSDISTARDLLAPDGIVVVDDYRAEQFPGVAAAVWPELDAGLVPLALSKEKLYATWGDPEPWQGALRARIERDGLPAQLHRLAGHEVVRVWSPDSRLAEWVPPALVPFAQRARKLLRG